MDLLKTSLILYPSLPGPRPKETKTYISSEPIVPTYDFPQYMWYVFFGAFFVGATLLFRLLQSGIAQLAEWIAKLVGN